MKNFAKSAGLLFVALGALCVTSCTHEDAGTPPIKKEATAFTSTSVTLTSEKVATASATGKQVQRGTLHAWIKDVIINVTSLDFTYNISTPFELIANQGNGNTTGSALPNYVLDNIAVGNNKFEVTTTTSSTEQLALTSSQDSPANIMTALKAVSPYALYGVTFNALVSNNGQLTPNYAQTLTTQHGKVAATFELTQHLKDLGVTAKVSATTSNSGSLNAIVVQGGLNGSFLWTNNNAVAGQSVTFKVELYNANGVLFKTMNNTVVNVMKSTALNNTYIISQDSITLNQTIEQFIAEPWNNNDETIIIE